MKYIIEEKCDRLDVFASGVSNLSRSFCQRLISEGKILVNGKQAKNKTELEVGDYVEFLQTEPTKLDLEPKNIDIDIVYQDKDLAVINKPQGLTVHAGNSYDIEPTLVNALLYHLDSLSSINGVIRPGIVHRIDKNTSGLLVVAKNDIAHKSLAEQIEKKTCKRTYIALLEGVLKQDQGEIETYIDRSKKDKTKMEVSDSGRIAKTFYKVLQRYENYTLVEFNLHTGRTHQIRVHSKYIMHPVVGDEVYGYKKQKFNLKGQLLHAYKLKFVHPTTNKEMEFSCDIPEHFLKVLKSIEYTKI